MAFKVRCIVICQGCGTEGTSITSDAPKVPREALAEFAKDNGFQIYNDQIFCRTCWPDRYKIEGDSFGHGKEKRIKVGPVGDMGQAKPGGQ